MTTQEILTAAKGAKQAVALADSAARSHALQAMADALCTPGYQAAILAANAEDLDAARGHISDVMLDRLARRSALPPWQRASGRWPPSPTRWGPC